MDDSVSRKRTVSTGWVTEGERMGARERRMWWVTENGRRSKKI